MQASTSDSVSDRRPARTPVHAGVQQWTAVDEGRADHNRRCRLHCPPDAEKSAYAGLYNPDRLRTHSVEQFHNRINGWTIHAEAFTVCTEAPRATGHLMRLSPLI